MNQNLWAAKAARTSVEQTGDLIFAYRRMPGFRCPGADLAAWYCAF
jgi:hypothetical protein